MRLPHSESAGWSARRRATPAKIARRQEGRSPDHFSHSSLNFSTAFARWSGGRSSNGSLPLGLRARRRNMPAGGSWGSKLRISSGRTFPSDSQCCLKACQARSRDDGFGQSGRSWRMYCLRRAPRNRRPSQALSSIAAEGSIFTKLILTSFGDERAWEPLLLANLKAPCALHFAHYNFCRVHS